MALQIGVVRDARTRVVARRMKLRLLVSLALVAGPSFLLAFFG